MNERYCNGCIYAKTEEWIKGTAIICVSPWSRAKKYVVKAPLNKQDKPDGPIYRPAWCKEKRI